MSILDQIDGFLNSQKESEAQVFFFLPILLFGFISYFLIYPITDENLKNAISKKEGLTSNITTTKNNINSNMANRNQSKRLIKQIDVELLSLNKTKKDMESLVNELVFLKFDLKDWSEFYNNIPNLAKDTNLDILSVTNRVINENLKNKAKKSQKHISKKNKKNKKNKEVNKQVIEKKSLLVKEIEISIKARGNFVDMVRFLYLLENKREMIKIKSIKTDGKEIDIIFDIYGARL